VNWETWGTLAAYAIVCALQAYLIRKRTRELRPRPTGTRPRRHIGELYLSELPGFLFILLAGAEYRRAAAGILERRAKNPGTPVAGLCYQQGKRETERVVARAVRTTCLRCGAPHLISGHCGPCYQERQRRRADRQIAELARTGKRPAEIADLLGVTPQTIRRIVIEPRSDRNTR
jgi:hypothetical protein